MGLVRDLELLEKVAHEPLVVRLGVEPEVVSIGHVDLHGLRLELGDVLVGLLVEADLIFDGGEEGEGDLADIGHVDEVSLFDT